MYARRLRPGATRAELSVKMLAGVSADETLPLLRGGDLGRSDRLSLLQS